MFIDLSICVNFKIYFLLFGLHKKNPDKTSYYACTLQSLKHEKFISLRSLEERQLLSELTVIADGQTDKVICRGCIQPLKLAFFALCLGLIWPRNNSTFQTGPQATNIMKRWQCGSGIVKAAQITIINNIYIYNQSGSFEYSTVDLIVL